MALKQETKDAILQWMFLGQTGVSSETMARVFLGMPRNRWGSHPHDPSDFNRCLMFLECVPECRARLSEMRSESPEWLRLVDRWEEIETCFLAEAGRDWVNGQSAPKTYELMRRVIDNKPDQPQ